MGKTSLLSVDVLGIHGTKFLQHQLQKQFCLLSLFGIKKKLLLGINIAREDIDMCHQLGKRQRSDQPAGIIK